jgi:hypothetical protein
VPPDPPPPTPPTPPPPVPIDQPLPPQPAWVVDQWNGDQLQQIYFDANGNRIN